MAGGTGNPATMGGFLIGLSAIAFLFYMIFFSGVGLGAGLSFPPWAWVILIAIVFLWLMRKK